MGQYTARSKIRTEFEEKEYRQIDDYCKSKILWSASAWDIDSQVFKKI